MSEKLEIFDLEGKSLGTQDRDLFYSEIKEEFSKSGKISRKVMAIKLLIMTSTGRIYLQKRSKIKSENAGMYDKTIGGHVSGGLSWDTTVVKEAAEELGFPVAVLDNNDFDSAILNTDLKIIGIIKKIDEIKKFESIRISNDGNKFIQPLITSFYIGYYDGSIRFVDGECSGIEVFSLDELMGEIKDNPNKFTGDIKFMISNYSSYIKPLTS